MKVLEGDTPGGELSGVKIMKGNVQRFNGKCAKRWNEYTKDKFVT